MVVRQPKISSRSTGFSLIELMVVLVLIGIMSTAALSGAQSMVQSMRVKTASQTLFYSLLLARSEAVKRNADVTITAASGGWNNGWDIASAGELIQRQLPLRSVTVSIAPNAVTFTRIGRLPSGVATPKFQVGPVSSSSSTIRCVVIDLSGRPRSLNGACS